MDFTRNHIQFNKHINVDFGINEPENYIYFIMFLRSDSADEQEKSAFVRKPPA